MASMLHAENAAREAEEEAESLTKLPVSASPTATADFEALTQGNTPRDSPSPMNLPPPDNLSPKQEARLLSELQAYTHAN